MFVESGKLTDVRLVQPAKALGPIVCNWELLAKLIVVRVDRPTASVIVGGVTVLETVLVPSVMGPRCWKVGLAILIKVVITIVIN